MKKTVSKHNTWLTVEKGVYMWVVADECRLCLSENILVWQET